MGTVHQIGKPHRITGNDVIAKIYHEFERVVVVGWYQDGGEMYIAASGEVDPMASIREAADGLKQIVEAAE